MSTGAHEPVVAALDDAWGAVLAVGGELDATEWDMPSECPGWSVRDLVSHLIGIERTLLGEAAPPALERRPAHVRNELGDRNEAWVAPRRGLPGAAVLEEFRSVTGRRLADLRSWPTARFDEPGPSPVGVVPYREFMAVRVMDSWVHEQDMRVATGRPGHTDGPAAELSLGRLSSALPFVVGKQAGAPEGASVRFEVAGPLGRTLDVAVRGGRASVVEDLPGRPATILTMDTEVFWRLACGRITGPAARDAGLVGLQGDAGLGAAVVDAMAFMV